MAAEVSLNAELKDTVKVKHYSLVFQLSSYNNKSLEALCKATIQTSSQHLGVCLMVLNPPSFELKDAMHPQPVFY